eukprot:10140372-Alexandrium_andersonii.AAC.1
MGFAPKVMGLDCSSASDVADASEESSDGLEPPDRQGAFRPLGAARQEALAPERAGLNAGGEVPS